MSQQINLFNPIFRKQKKYFSSVTMLQGLAIICVACALLAADAARRMRALQGQAAASAVLLTETEQRRELATVQFPPRKRDPVIGAQIAEASAELAALQGASATLRRGDFGNAQGFSGYFHAFARRTVPGLWLTDLTISGANAQIGVKGNTLRAELVPAFMAELAQEPIMKGKSFSALNIAQAVDTGPSADPVAPRRYLSFKLEAYSAAPVAAAPP
ncbi:MAG: PilN domain-containing protein [Pseudomonadota bacterium]